MGINVTVWDAWNQDLYLYYFFLIRRVLFSFCERWLAILAVKTDLGTLAGNIPSSSEFQICPSFQVSQGSASSHCFIWMIKLKKSTYQISNLPDSTEASIKPRKQVYSSKVKMWLFIAKLESYRKVKPTNTLSVDMCMWNLEFFCKCNLRSLCYS